MKMLKTWSVITWILCLNSAVLTSNSVQNKSPNESSLSRSKRHIPIWYPYNSCFAVIAHIHHLFEKKKNWILIIARRCFGHPAEFERSQRIPVVQLRNQFLSTVLWQRPGIGAIAVRSSKFCFDQDAVFLFGNTHICDDSLDWRSSREPRNETLLCQWWRNA